MASHGEALLPAAQALVGARRPTPAIPGQQTWEQLCLRRGPVAVVCAEAPSAAAWRVAAAAWAVGNPVTLVVAASQVAAATTAAGGMAEVVAGEGPDAVANALAGRAWGTLVADGGALAPPVVAASVTHGLPQLLDAAIAASGDDRTLIHGQLLANTVAVNTLRYGAPLVLDLGAAG